jgi:hypothetical protein
MRRYGWFLRGGRAAAVLLVGLGVLAGCSEKVVDPDKVSTNVIESHFVPRRENAEGVATNPAVPTLDGKKLDKEWGSPDLSSLPWKAVRLSSDDGAGNPGSPKYIFLKSVYTEKHVYFLVQWDDPTKDITKDILTYVGPDLDRLPVGECYGQYLLNPDDWTKTESEDWVSLAFEIDPASDAKGSFADQGCLVACHGGSFGTPTTGKLDVWLWLASRTNPPLVLVNPNDSPINPAEGEAGYADDRFADANGLQPDAPDSMAAYKPNFDPGSTVPNYMYRDVEGLCDPQNGGLKPVYEVLWWPCMLESFRIDPCDTLNPNPVDQTDPRKWHAGDTVPGYLLQVPQGGRANIRAKGTWDEDRSVWTLEMSRALLATSDPEHDVNFDLSQRREYRFTIAIADNSTDVHYGSKTQILRFLPH